MIAPLLHRLLRYWLFRIPSRNIARMPLVSILDLPFAVVLGPRLCLQTINLLRLLRQQLTLKDWSSLSEIYPRTVMWLYVYCVFLWARYCGVLAAIMAQPDKLVIGENFLRYICQIDNLIDTSPDKARLVGEADAIASNPGIQAVLDELQMHLRQLNVPVESRTVILDTIGQYQAEALRALQRSVWYPRSPLENVLTDKAQTAGNLLVIWTKILGHLYDVPENVSQHAAELFFNMSMAVQCLDDFGDVPVDYAENTQNLFIALVSEDAEEWLHLNNYLSIQTEKFLDWEWARVHLPRSLEGINKLYHGYIQPLLNDNHRPDIALELYHTIERIRGMGNHPISAVASAALPAPPSSQIYSAQ